MKLIGCDGVHSDQSVILDALVLLDTTISRNESNAGKKRYEKVARLRICLWHQLAELDRESMREQQTRSDRSRIKSKWIM